MDRRRRAISALAALPHLLWSPLLRAQQAPKVWRVGILSSRPVPTPTMPDVVIDAFVKAMADLGYVEGRNLVIERHFTGADFSRLSEYAADLARQKVDVIVLGSGGTRAARATREATKTIPIVSSAIGNPVLAGLADSLARPGKNVTGITNIAGDLELKRFELLREILPKLDRVAYLLNPDIQASIVDLGELQSSLKRRGIDLLLMPSRSDEEIDRAFVEIRNRKIRGAVFATEATLRAHISRLVELSLKNKLPAAMGFSEAADAGLLLAYGPELSESGRQMATYVDKIFKGANPGELPMEGPKTVELVVNLKTAKALGLTVPKAVVLRADRVIQ